MKSFRKILFWMHLTAGATAGIVIFIMCLTGALLAFEKQIIEYAENDVRYVNIPSGAAKLSPQQIVENLREQRPDAKASAMSITNEADAAWSFNLGRDGQVYVDPYTGEITGEGNKSVRGLMSELRNWHRYVALSGDGRPIGKAVTGVANTFFLFLAISGIYIWMPRVLSWRSVKPVIWFRPGLRGKPRNFNWHNTIGFWTSLLLIVFTVTATVISYQWASNLIYTLTGNEVPPQQSGGNQPTAEKIYEYPTNFDGAWAAAERQASEWRSISLRLPIEKDSAVFTIDEGIYWNIFGRSTLTTEVATGSVTKWEPYGEQNSARQIRSWFRFTHTGESGGIIGQILGFVACVGGAFLVWTGFSLALRRFKNWRDARSASGSA